jgi:hypothetical protein
MSQGTMDFRKKSNLTIKDVIESLESIRPHVVDGIDKQDAHEYADLLLLNALRIAGRQDVVDAYLEVKRRFDGFWYA